jgi:hypothetical protein
MPGAPSAGGARRAAEGRVSQSIWRERAGFSFDLAEQVAGSHLVWRGCGDLACGYGTRHAPGEGLSAAVSVADLLSARWDACGDAGLAEVWLPAGFEVTYAGPDGREVRGGLDRLRRADLEACQPVRSFPSYQGQRNYPGWYWSATMGRRVGFESWVERGHLVALDFDPAVTAIVSQPFWLHWRTPAGKARRHSPDFFARHVRRPGAGDRLPAGGRGR